MKTKHFTPIVALALMSVTLTAATWAQSYKEVINAGAPAVYPGSPFTADGEDNLYTSVANGGLSQCLFYACGAIYQWKPGAHRQPTMLYSFSGSTDGAGPGGSLVFDAHGNLYGTAGYAGDLTACFQQGCGVVYKLSPTSSGFWTQTVLYTFEGGTDGITPISVVLDANGNIFGLTRDGGGNSCSGGQECGTVFELTPTSSGPWTETILHTFTVAATEASRSAPLPWTPTGICLVLLTLEALSPPCARSGAGRSSSYLPRPAAAGPSHRFTLSTIHTAPTLSVRW